MDLLSLDDLLSAKRIIYVTGPNRSGTTIGSKIIAHNLGMKWVREESFGFRNRNRFVKIKEGVVQCPQMMQHLIAMDGKDVAHVCMIRGIEAIQSSFYRQLDKTGKPIREHSTKGHDALVCQRLGYPYNQAVASYLYWLLDLKPHLYFAYELAYDELRRSPLFCEDRTGWHHRQTEP